MFRNCALASHGLAMIFFLMALGAGLTSSSPAASEISGTVATSRSNMLSDQQFRSWISATRGPSVAGAGWWIRSALLRVPGTANTLLPAAIQTSPANGIQSKAVLRLTLDNEWKSSNSDSGVQFEDEASEGNAKDSASLPRGGTRLPSLFTAGDSGAALLLNDGQKQLLQVPHSADVDRPEAVTVSGLFANLHASTDAGMHGLFAKRQPAAPSKTNYGINFAPASDAFQVYVNDGSGFKVAVYSVKSTIGFRRRVHLAASFLTADAPGADQDSDADDVQIRLFVNGAPATPVSVTAGFVEGTSAWLQDVQLAGCCSETPLTVGSSFVDGEPAHIICDELQVFASALTDEQVSGLFQEIVGSEAGAIAAEASSASEAASLVPVVGRLSQYGLTIGQTNQLTVTGRNLQNATARFSLSGVAVRSMDGGKPGQQRLEIDVPEGVVPGRYAIRMVNEHGLSRPVMISVDGFPQAKVEQFSEAEPAVNLPLAVTGFVSGTEQARVYFSGSKGQSVVAEIEARRLGSRLDPVVEIKTAVGRPLAVQWQQPHLGGDARAVAELTEDGKYYVEVHDLQFRAPANSPFRLLLGNIAETGVAYPSAVGGESREVRTAGLNRISEPVSIRSENKHLRLEGNGRLAPLPPLLMSDGREITEPLEGTFDSAPVDATFTVEPFPPIYMNGRIMEGTEEDQMVFTVTPGQVLRIEATAQKLNSPLRPVLSLFSADARVAFSDGDSGASDPFLDYTVPEGVTQLTLKVRDFTGRGSPGSVYRVMIARRDRPAFELHAAETTLRIPANGSAPLRLSVIRQSPSFQYFGPIRLQASGIPGVSVVPDVIPASETNQEVLLVVTHQNYSPAAADALAVSTLLISGEAPATSSKVTATVRLQPDLVPAGQTTFESAELLATQSSPLTATIALSGPPPVLLRGLPAQLGLRLLSLQDVRLPFVRFELLTTERTRLTDPNNAQSAPKPRISAPEFQFGSTDTSEFTLTLEVPLDVEEQSIDALVGARFVRQPLEAGSDQTAWTAPIRLAIDDAVQVQTPGTLKGKKGTDLILSGSIVRHPQFGEPVVVSFSGLPKDATAAPVQIAPDETSFQLTLNVPEATASGAIPDVVLHVKDQQGRLLLKPAAITVTVE